MVKLLAELFISLYTIIFIASLNLTAVQLMKNNNEKRQDQEERTSIIQQITIPFRALSRKLSSGRSSASSSGSSSPSSLFKNKCSDFDILIPLTPKNAKCCCNGYIKREMVKISFYSSIGNRNNSVKVSLQKPISSGMQAQVYHGCYYDSSSKENKCVAVKLLGTGPRQSQFFSQDTCEKQKKLYKSLSSKDHSQLSRQESILKEVIEKTFKSVEKSKLKMKEGIAEDSLNEISLLKKFQEKFENQNSINHIIGMYDGGAITKIQGDRDKDQKYSYIIILELGTETFREKMLSIAKNYIEKDEEMLINTLKEPAHVQIQIHQVAIHMDFKPQNMVYVPSKDGDILKGIDFGGSLLVNGERPSMWNNKICINSKAINRKECKRTLSLPANVEGSISLQNNTNQQKSIVDKITCTRQYLPPELDNSFLYEQSILNGTATENPVASTKSDVWMFGIMCYEFLLYIKYYKSFENDIESLKETINKKLLRINDLYKWKKELLAQDKSENRHKMSNILVDEDVEHRASTSQLDSISEQPSIFDFKDEINDILEIKKDYPRLFQLITMSLLQLSPKNRLSSIGLLDFLSGKCRLRHLRSEILQQNIKEYPKEKVGIHKSLLDVFSFEDEFNNLLHHDTNNLEICDYEEKVNKSFKKLTSFNLLKNIDEVKIENELVEKNKYSLRRRLKF